MSTTPTGEASARVARMDWKPRTCVWELTLACNLRCNHCGSRAGDARPDELDLDQCFDLVDQLADLGCELVTLSGGEPTMRPGWDRIARAIVDRGMYANMVTNGVYRQRDLDEVVGRAANSGICNVGVSIDGPEAIHDLIRGRGTFARSLTAIERFVATGTPVGVLTTVSRQNLRHLADVRQLAMDAGASQWRVQLAKPMGAMADDRNLVLQPRHLLELIPTLARLKKKGGIDTQVGDSIGYYGPHDTVLRGRGWRGRREVWKGCQAGMQAIGIEADGGVKGCLSMQASLGGGDSFREGSVRDERLEQIWFRPGVFAYNRDFELSSLRGGCRGCSYDSVCRGGARCVAAAFTGGLAEDPYCFHRVSTDARPASRRPVNEWAAAKGAAIALSIGASACATPVYGISPPGVVDGAGSSDAKVEDGKADSDAGGGQETVSADSGSVDSAGTGADDVSMQPDNGVPPPDVKQGDADAGSPKDDTSSPDVEPGDAVMADAGEADGIDCSNACCMCDYGMPPPPECCPP